MTYSFLHLFDTTIKYGLSKKRLMDTVSTQNSHSRDRDGANISLARQANAKIVVRHFQQIKLTDAN